MPDGGLVLGPVLRGGVAARALGFGRVRVGEVAPKHQQAQEERGEHHARFQHAVDGPLKGGKTTTTHSGTFFFGSDTI